jgi:methyltransferase-like protein/2-polyprenyl-3-methyl-5-hydroxy-6-metoxy-1,4-benzoquinol methylase
MSSAQTTPSTTSSGAAMPTASLPKVACSYDDIPYASYPVATSHPDRLYNIARLFGMDPVRPERARILELGCAGGGNLLPVASQFPDCFCLGIELSEVQCRDANLAIKFVGLDNIEVRQGSISDIRPELGKFDYIVCHGVFSWVPESVRDDILRVASENLADQGVAFVSYNTLPGWYLRGMVRGMMLQHVQAITDPRTKIIQAKALLKFLVESTATHETPYASYLKAEAEFLDKLPDHYLFHEHLEEHNKAFFFQEFVRHASKHELQFLGESTLPTMWIGNLSPSALKTLETIDDSVVRGQITDCIVGRTFRETLLVHKKVAIDRNLNATKWRDVRFFGSFTDVTEKPIDANATPAKKSFKTKHGVTLTTEKPSQIAIEALNQAYPGSLSISEICETIESGLAADTSYVGKPMQMDSNQLSTVMMQWALSGYLEMRLLPDRMQTRDIRRPKMTAWARSQARAGSMVTNLRHEGMTLTDVHRFIAPLLDGTRDMSQIAIEIDRLNKAGILKIESSESNTAWNSKETPYIIAQQLIAQLAGMALILPEN